MSPLVSRLSQTVVTRHREPSVAASLMPVHPTERRSSGAGLALMWCAALGVVCWGLAVVIEAVRAWAR